MSERANVGETPSEKRIKVAADSAKVIDAAQLTLETLELAITNVIDLSMEHIDYGNTELNGKVMETLHRLRMSQVVLEKALEAAE